MRFVNIDMASDPGRIICMLCGRCW